MKSTKRFWVIIRKLIKYIIYYLVVLIFVGFIFGLLYWWNGEERSFYTSYENLIGMDIGQKQALRASSQAELFRIIISFAEKTLKTIIDFFLIAVLVSKAFTPVCPIVFSKYAIYDTDNGENSFIFRYWIMTKRRHFLYDVKIHVFLAEISAFGNDVNKIVPIWEWSGNNPGNETNNHVHTHLDEARGVRYIKLDTKESDRLTSILASATKEERSRYSLYVSMRAYDNRGHTFFKQTEYVLYHIVRGYGFVPVSERDRFSVERLKKEEPSYKGPLGKLMSEGIPFTNYQNFEKLYKYSDKSGITQKKTADVFDIEWTESAENNAKNDVLQDLQIIFGRETGVKKVFVGLANRLTWWYYDCDSIHNPYSDQKGKWRKHRKIRRKYKKELAKLNANN